MAFQIKDFVSIAASLINWMRTATNKITDFNVGSVARTMVEAPAAEIDELYQQMFIGLKESIPVSTYYSFSFERIEAVPTSGLVRVVIASTAADVLIPAGTVFTPNPAGPVTYTSTADVTITAGNTFANVPTVANVAGSAGNLIANTGFQVNPTPDNFVSATNLSPFQNGTDQETDDERKIRFNAFIETLNRGTVKALGYGLLTTVLYDSVGNEIERVRSATVVEPWLTDANQPVSLVNCYIHNGTGGTSSDLVTFARKVIYGYYDETGKGVPGWKAAGVHVEIYAATELTVDVTGVLTALPGYVKADLVAAAVQSIYGYLLGLPTGESALKSKIIEIVMDIEGVYNFIPSAPSGDVSALDLSGWGTIKLMPGAITIT